MKGVLVVYPAYGRKYETPEAMEADWFAGKDFSASPYRGPYLSIRDFQNDIFELSNFAGVLLTQVMKGSKQVVVWREGMKAQGPVTL